MPKTKTPEQVRAYHQRSKHDFGRYAASPGFLDWNTQPNPFRRFEGAPQTRLPLSADRCNTPYADLFRSEKIAPATLDLEGVGQLLELAFGLAAWKQYGDDRWALRCNPSSGNLHPTEAYVIAAGVPGLENGVHHYVSHDHLLELRCRFNPSFRGLLVSLSSIHWREAWKYGERAFRYCQHDVGHALGALSYAAAALGWRVRLLDAWGDEDIAALLGLDRHEDFTDAETEAADLLCLIDVGRDGFTEPPIDELLNSARAGHWLGQANKLSASHRFDWPVIEEVCAAARKPRTVPVSTGLPVDGNILGSGNLAEEPCRRSGPCPRPDRADRHPSRAWPAPTEVAGSGVPFADHGAARSLLVGQGLDSTTSAPLLPTPSELPAAVIIKQRRSAQAFDGVTALTAKALFRILDATLPRADIPPFDAWNWPPRVHLVLFLHRVRGLPPGLYSFCRSGDAERRLREAMKQDFAWEPAEDCPGHLRLFRLLRADARQAAKALSCHQDIAGDGAFSLGMLTEFDAGLAEGSWVYRRLFWECGLIGQALYLEAEAAGARGTGIGCFFDDPVHELLGLQGSTYQSLYHFTVGGPLVDERLQSLPGYWHVRNGRRRQGSSAASTSADSWPATLA